MWFTIIVLFAYGQLPPPVREAGGAVSPPDSGGLLQVLISMGLPAAIVGMVIVALVFRREHPTVSRWAAFAAVGLFSALGIIEVVDRATARDLTITITPSDAAGSSQAGLPTEIEVSVNRGSTSLKKQPIRAVPAEAYRSRPLTVAQGGRGLAVMYENLQIGTLDRARLNDAGWRLAEECGTSGGQPRFWHTGRIYAGQNPRLGDSFYGKLRLRALRFAGDGQAVVTLTLEGRDPPMPLEIPIKNKGLGVQSFSEVADFYIAVREADFTTTQPWASFSVFSAQ